jgi:hypothetical protein
VIDQLLLGDFSDQVLQNLELKIDLIFLLEKNFDEQKLKSFLADLLM